MQETSPTSKYDRRQYCGICHKPLDFGNHLHLFDRALNRLVGRKFVDYEMQRCLQCGGKVSLDATTCPTCRQAL